MSVKGEKRICITLETDFIFGGATAAYQAEGGAKEMEETMYMG